MKLLQVGSNQTILETEDARILFSYETPVAAYVYGKGYIKTSQFHSRTTSKHINAFIGQATATAVSQEELNKLTE